MNKIRFLLLGIVLIITAGCFGSNKDISFEFEIKNISSENVYVELTGIGVKDKLTYRPSSSPLYVFLNIFPCLSIAFATSIYQLPTSFKGLENILLLSPVTLSK